MTSRAKKGDAIPPKPQEPMPGECCGRGCDPCVYDYYERALKRWEEKVAKIQSGKAETDN